jgi:hypothetical protein
MDDFDPGSFSYQQDLMMLMNALSAYELSQNAISLNGFDDDGPSVQDTVTVIGERLERMDLMTLSFLNDNLFGDFDILAAILGQGGGAGGNGDPDDGDDTCPGVGDGTDGNVYPEGVNMDELRDLANEIADILYDLAHNSLDIGFVEYGSFLIQSENGDLRLSQPLTSADSSVVDFHNLTPETVSGLLGINSSETVVGFVHIHFSDGRASGLDAEFFERLAAYADASFVHNFSVELNGVMYVIDGDGNVYEYTKEALDAITDTESDELGDTVDDDGTLEDEC